MSDYRKFTMRKIAFLFTIVLLLIGANSAKASHIQGMNISYKHINGDTFVVTLDFWRYCGGTAFSPTGNYQNAAGGSPSANYTIYCDEVGFNLSRNVPVDTFFEASPICASQSFLSSCATPGSGLLGIQWYIYRDTLVLSQLAVTSCDEWKFVYATGARNSGTNYTSQPSIAVFNEFVMDEDATNSSVQFNTVKPIPFFCDGQPVVYNWGATELDGDSLHWELDTAASGYSNITQQFSYITYNNVPAGMAAVNGLEPIPGITIDSLSGQVEFTAFIPPGFQFANYAVAVKVSEYDAFTGAYKGTTQRDVQFIVLDSCDNNPPTQDPLGITSFQGSGALLDSNTVEVCFGQNFEFELIYFDYDTSGALSSDSITVNCNIGDVLPGATWVHSATNPDTVTLSWTAVPTSTTFAPFNVTVEDDFCPITGFNIYNYVVKITPSTFLPADTAICSVDSIDLFTIGGDTFTYEVIMNPDSTMGDPLVPGQTIECNPCIGNDMPWLNLATTTTIRVVSNLNATCGNDDTITVTVFDNFPIDITPAHGGTPGGLVYCASDGLDTLLGVTPGGTWLGAGIVNPAVGVIAPDVLNPGTGNDTIVQVVYLLDFVDCPNQDTVSIKVKGLPDSRILSKGPYCVQTDEIQLAGVDTGGVWTGPNTTAVGIFDPSAYAATAPVDSILIFHTIDDSGCVNMDSTYISVINSFSSKIDSLPKLCAGETELLFLNAFEGDPNGVWKGDKIYEEPAGSGNFFFNTEDLRAGNYQITYEIEGECGTSTSEDLVINPLPDATIFGADSVYCDNIVDSILLEPATEGGVWGGNMTELHDGYFVPFQIGEGLYNITYELYDKATTCYNKNIVPVRIARTPVKPKLYGGGPYCQGTLVNVRGDGLLSNTYKWFSVSNGDSILLGAGNPFNIGAVVEMPTVIYGTQVSKYGCESPTSRLRIEVLPAPSAEFEADTLYGNIPLNVNFTNLSGPDSINLLSTWTFGDYLVESDSSLDSTSFLFEDIGTYPVTLEVDNGQCSNKMTLYVTADKLTHFFIPNVITPNGDGTNDFLEWKIDGIGEFKISVFNRWGMRVFQSEDIEEFWDGGSEPSGVYYYIMTGKEKTLREEKVEWRGDFTLIRDK